MKKSNNLSAESKGQVKAFETEGYNNLKELIKNNFAGEWNLRHTADGERIDVQATGSGSTWDVEIKCRNMEWHKFPTYLIEQDKYKSLMSYSPNNEKVYINFFDDGWALAWNLKEIGNVNQYAGAAYCPVMTVANEKKYILKDVFYLPVSKAKRYKYKDTKINEIELQVPETTELF